jgi:anti-sigma-K factor RskA
VNTPPDGDNPDSLRYAEYVLGVLDADARAAVAREVASSEAAAAAVASWEKRLAALASELPEVTPSQQVWTRIREALDLDARREPLQRQSLWANVNLWRWLTVGATAVAAACVVLILRTTVQAPILQGGRGVLMVASLRQDNGVTDWTTTIDLGRKQIVVVPAAAASIAADRSTQLWLIPAGRAPISVGVFTPSTATVLPLTSNLLAQLGPTAALAVSVEPAGGSPTGQPTGPVIAKGLLSGTS